MVTMAYWVYSRSLLVWLLAMSLALGAFVHVASAVSTPTTSPTTNCYSSGMYYDPNYGGYTYGNCPHTTSESITTYFDNGRAGGGSLTPSAQGTSTETPVEAAVHQYNNDSLQWLITCPVAPNPKNTTEYFYTNMSAGAYSYVGGDRCLASTSPYSTTVTFKTLVTWQGSGNNAIANAMITANDIGPLGNVQASDLGYSGGICANGQAMCPNSILASSFDSESYIFNVTPSQPQQGIWTWNSKYTNLSQLDTQQGRINQQYTFPDLIYYENYGPSQTTSSTSGPPYHQYQCGSAKHPKTCQYPTYYTTYRSWSWTCKYTYTFGMQAQILHINNTKIPIPLRTSAPQDDQLYTNHGYLGPIFTDSSLSGGGPSIGFLSYNPGSCAYQMASKTWLGFGGPNQQVQCSGYTFEYQSGGTVYYSCSSCGPQPAPNSQEQSVNVYAEQGDNNKLWFSYCSQYSNGFHGIFAGCQQWEAAYVNSTGAFTNTTVLPYFLYNISVPVLATSLSGSPNSIEYLNLSLDLYSPHNYLDPGNYLAPFPVSTDSGFFATYNGYLTEYPPTVVSLKNPNPSGFNLPITNKFTTSLNSIAPSLLGLLKNKPTGIYANGGIPHPQFIYAAPDDYIYVLNTTSTCGFLCFNSNTNVNMYTMRFIPQGFYNVSNDQPNMPNMTKTGEYARRNWNSNWTNYWNNTLAEQNSNLYIVNITPVSNISSNFWSLSGKFTSNNFLPTAITGDYQGDVFMLGFNTSSCWAVFNCVSNNKMVIGERPAHGYISLNTTVPLLFAPTTEFAASPNGQYLYVANPGYGNVSIFKVGSVNASSGPASASQPFTHFGNISLSYSNASANMNISAYLANGGPFNIPSSQIPGALKNLPTANDINADHHPIGIADSFGTLYVLDDWNFTIPCGSGCSGNIYGNMLMLRAFSGNGTEVPIDPFQSRDTIPVTAPSTSVTAPPSVTISKPLFPPFGWPLSVNISVGGSGQGSGASPTPILNYCAIAPQCNIERGTPYPPIGPFIPAYENVTNYPGYPVFGIGNGHAWVSPNGLPDRQEVLAVNPNDTAFSSDFNGTMYILSHFNSSNTAGEFSSQPQYTELLALRPELNNYTKLSLGAQSPYVCYLNSTTGLSDSLCMLQYPVNSLTYTTGPIEEVPSSFKFASGEGSPLSFLSIASSLSSLLPNGAGTSSSGSSSGTCTSSGTPENSLLAANGLISNSGPNGNSCVSPSNSFFNQPSTVSIPGLSSTVAPISLSSKIAGYVIIPYNVTYNEQRSWTETDLSVTTNNGNCYSSPSPPSGFDPCSAAAPPYPSGYPIACGQSDSATCAASQNSCATPPQLDKGIDVTNTVTNDTTEYTFQQINASASSYNSIIEGGPTYLEPNGTNNYYNANLSDAGLIVPPYLDYLLMTNRVFGEIYINQTDMPLNGGPGGAPISPPQVINASNNYTYQQSYVQQVSSLSTNPAYDVELAMPRAQTLFGVRSDSGYYNPASKSQLNNLFGYKSTPGTTFASLFQIYHQSSYVNNIMLNLTHNGHILGYNRLVYAYVDRFNNTILMPLDVDFANITSITLNVTPIVSTSSPNETFLQVNGSAVFFPGFLSTTPYPLPKGTPIYLYYDTNLDFYNASYNGQAAAGFPLITNGAALPNDYLAYEERCRFSPNPVGCVLANPLSELEFSNGQVVPGQQNITGMDEANYITFHPQYNSIASNTCSNESPSLLQIANVSCNIYDSPTPPYGPNKLPPFEAPTTSRPYALYCEPEYNNGTGILTSQLGLMGIVHTNTAGTFSYNTNVCGTGTGRIIAQYYGYPPPEPQIFNQPAISQSAGTGEFSQFFLANDIATAEFNYSFAPNETLTSFPIGSYILSYGDISVIITIVLVAAVVLTLVLLRMHGNAVHGQHHRRG